MTIYRDSEYRCHAEDGEGRTAFEVPFFDGMCSAAIECYLYVADGELWTREDGEVFHGEMITPFVDSRILGAYQRQYEIDAAELEDADAALAELGVIVDG